MNQIKLFISKIRLTKEYRIFFSKEEDVFIFYGDGLGKFEQEGTSATKEVVEDYIRECLDQVRIANRYLDRLE